MPNFSIEQQFNIILQLIRENPSIEVKKVKGQPFDLSNKAHQEYLFETFKKGREVKHPQEPSTISDSAYIDVMLHYYGCQESSETIEKIHKTAMASENIVGDILERYIASVLEEFGWVWVAGSIIRAVDFIYKNNENKWVLLQIKNRDNSENSSSSSIRNGTDIIKWFRSFSRKKETNWKAFPYKPAGAELSEEGFRKFLIAYVKSIKNT